VKGPQGTDRTWLAGGAGGAVLLLLAAWFAVINPELSSAADVRDQTAVASTQNTVLQHKVAVLREQYATIDTLGVELGAQRAALPADSGLPAFTRQLTEQATAAGESLTSITTGEPGLVAAPAAAPPAAPASGAAAQPTGPATAPGTVTSAVGQLLSIPVTVVVDGPLAGHRALLTALQQTGPRRALVGSVVLAPATGQATASVDGTTTMTVTLQVFVAPQASTPPAAAPAVPPTPTTAPS
jgi:hypothetical protein